METYQYILLGASVLVGLGAVGGIYAIRSYIGLLDDSEGVEEVQTPRTQRPTSGLEDSKID
jgi:hypothetical protein